MTKCYKAGATDKMQVRTLTATVAVVGANGLLLGPVLADVATSLGTLPASIAWAMSAYGTGTTLSALLLAPLIDRFGERSALQLGIAILFAAFLASTVAGNILILSSAQFLAGLGAGLVLPASYGMATLLAKPGKEAGTLGRVLIGWSLSLVAGVPVAAFIAEHLNWRMSYCLLTAGVAWVGLLVRRFPPQAANPQGAGPRITMFSAIRIYGVLPMLIIALVYTGSFYGVYAFVARETQRALAVSTGRAGLVVFAFGIGFAVATFASRVLDRCGARRLFPAILLANGVVYAMMIPAIASFQGILFLAILWGSTNYLCLNSIVILLTRMNPDARGVLLGLNSATTYLGLTLGTALASRIYPLAGFDALAWGAAVMHIAAACYCVMFSKSIGKAHGQNETLHHEGTSADALRL